MENKENILIDKKVEKEDSKPNRLIIIAVALIVIGLAVGSGYFLSNNGSLEVNRPMQRDVAKDEIKSGVTVGIADEKNFKDSAEGTLEKGGIDGEGSHHLARPGGDSQNVYLTSSVIDLDKFVAKKVKVWGQTFSAQKAGWFMDVGKLKVL